MGRTDRAGVRRPRADTLAPQRPSAAMSRYRIEEASSAENQADGQPG
jgi:hypothetical protein